MGQIFKTKRTIEIQLVGPTEVCGKVLSEKNAYNFVKTASLLSNGIAADHQNSCLFTNKGHFSSPLWVSIGVLAKSYEENFANSSNYTLRTYLNNQFSLEKIDM